MRKKTRLQLMLIKELMDFDILDYLYINRALRYAQSILVYIVNVFQK